MKLKGDAKFKGKLTCGLKNGLSNLVNFYASSWKPGNLYFDGLLLSKTYKDLKVQKSYVSWHWRVMQILKKNWLLIPKITWGIWLIFMRAVESLEIYTLMCYFCQYYVKFQLKIYTRIVSHDTEKRSKLWRKTNSFFRKWPEKFDKLYLEQ